MRGLWCSDRLSYGVARQRLSVVSVEGLVAQLMSEFGEPALEDVDGGRGYQLSQVDCGANEPTDRGLWIAADQRERTLSPT